MNDIIKTCALAAHEGTLRFPEIVKRLLEAGVTHYQVDYLKNLNVYYGPNQESQIEPLHLPSGDIATVFGQSEVAAAVKASQQDGLPYTDFLKRSMQAGCIGYIVFLDGQRVIYFGRLGDTHVEHFPGSPFVD